MELCSKDGADATSRNLLERKKLERWLMPVREPLNFRVVRSQHAAVPRADSIWLPETRFPSCLSTSSPLELIQLILPELMRSEE